MYGTTVKRAPKQPKNDSNKCKPVCGQEVEVRLDNGPDQPKVETSRSLRIGPDNGTELEQASGRLPRGTMSNRPNSVMNPTTAWKDISDNDILGHTANLPTVSRGKRDTDKRCGRNTPSTNNDSLNVVHTDNVLQTKGLMSKGQNSRVEGVLKGLIPQNLRARTLSHD